MLQLIKNSILGDDNIAQINYFGDINTYEICSLNELTPPSNKFYNSFEDIRSLVGMKSTLLIAAIILKKVDMTLLLLNSGMLVRPNLVKLADLLCDRCDANDNAEYAKIYHLLMVNIRNESDSVIMSLLMGEDINSTSGINEQDIAEIEEDTLTRYYKRRYKYGSLDNVGRLMLVSNWSRRTPCLMNAVNNCSVVGAEVELEI